MFQVEKKAVEKDVEMYKKRTQDLVEKLNRAKPEEFLRMQQELNHMKNTLQTKEAEVTRMKAHVTQLQKSLQAMVSAKDELKKQLTASTQDKAKLLEDTKKLTLDKSRLVAQVGQHQERQSSLQAEQQQEQMKQLDQRNKLLIQVGDCTFGQRLLYHRTCKPDFLCSWPSLNSCLK